MGASGDEKMSSEFHTPVTIEKTSKILEQMKDCICKIKSKNGKGTGFFCSIRNKEEEIKVLITSCFILDKKILNETGSIALTINNDKEEKTIELNEKRKIYSNKDYNITIVEIKEKKDEINNFLELDENILKDDYNILNESIYILQYAKLGKEQLASVSYGMLKEIEDFDIINFCSTKSGSIGSPILNLSNNKVIGVHREASTKNSPNNKGTFLKNPIEEFIANKNLVEVESKEVNDTSKEVNDTSKEVNETSKEVNKKSKEDNKKSKEVNKKSKEVNDTSKEVNKKSKEDNKKSKEVNKTSKEVNKTSKEVNKTSKEDIKTSGKNEIIIKLKIGKKDVGKEIYFLDNTNIFDENLVKHYHDFLKELDETNVDLFINDVQEKYTKFSTFKEEGTYTIKLKLKIRIKDCSYMFCNCVNITNIDFSNFDTRNINNMYRMFYNCENLTELDFSSFNTSKVTNMYSLFEKCYNLTSANLTSFDTENVTNISRMFFGCKNLKKVDLSSFDDDNFDEFKELFEDCNSLSEVKISKNFYDKIQKEMPSDKIEFVLL